MLKYSGAGQPVSMSFGVKAIALSVCGQSENWVRSMEGIIPEN
ncbi:hypothetical protein [Brasilonema sp. UFV-L1]|nr:hypothetical protein [Brasilonema sp. UFV-L1]